MMTFSTTRAPTGRALGAQSNAADDRGKADTLEGARYSGSMAVVISALPPRRCHEDVNFVVDRKLRRMIDD